MPPGKKPNLSSYDVVASVAVAKRRAIYPQTDAICCYDASSDLLRAEPLPMIIKEHGTADIATPTGPMRLHVFQPAAPGRYPGLVLYSEIFQITAPANGGVFGRQWISRCRAGGLSRVREAGHRARLR